MGIFLTKRAEDLRQGGIRAFFDKAAAYSDVINLGIGEPDLDTPRAVIGAGCQAMLEGKTHYTANAGELPVREQVAAYLTEFGVTAHPDGEIIDRKSVV